MWKSLAWSAFDGCVPLSNTPTTRKLMYGWPAAAQTSIGACGSEKNISSFWRSARERETVFATGSWSRHTTRRKNIANASCGANVIHGVKKRLTPHLQAGTASVLLPPMADELMILSHILGQKSSGISAS